MNDTATIERPVYKREVRRIPREQKPVDARRRHALGHLRALIEEYPQDAVEIVRQVCLDRAK